MQTLTNIKRTIACSLAIASAAAIYAPLVWAAAGSHMTTENIPHNQIVRPLAGRLDNTAVLNSNCPELVTGEGILVSTLSGKGRDVPENHLNFKFKNDFALFFHHINKQSEEDAKKTLYVSWIAFNPQKKDAKLIVSEEASYLSQPDAPFVERPALAPDPDNTLYSGPGDRLTADFIHDTFSTSDTKSARNLPLTITVPAGEMAIVRQMDVPVADLKYHHNGRSFYARGNIQGALNMATIATFSESGPPSLAELEALLQRSLLAHPREYEELAPTPDDFKGRFVYGRVSGVQTGAKIEAAHSLTLSKASEATRNYPISSLVNGTFGTGEIQSAPLLRRYPDTAYSAHGNYCVDYKVNLTIRNNDYIKRKLYVGFDCPLKADIDEIKYAERPEKAVFFRGSLKVSSEEYERFYHFVLHKGEALEPFESFEVEPGQTRTVTVELLYPPDATPPQLLKFYSPQSELPTLDLNPVIRDENRNVL